MDPNETFRTFVNAICADELDAALDSLIDLESWMASGGFAPHFLCGNDVPKNQQCPVPMMFVRNMIDVLGIACPNHS